MAEPIIETPAPNEQNNIGHIVDNELDDALSKSFPGMRPEPDTVADKEEVKQEQLVQKPDAKPELPKNQDKKEEPKRSEKPVVEKVEKPTLSQDEVEKLDPSSKGAWGAIKNANKRAHSMIEEIKAENAKLKASLAEKSSGSQKDLDALKAQISELQKYRAMIEIEADPEFVSKYDKPIQKLESDIKSFLKKRNVDDQALNNLNINDTRMMSQLIGIIDKDEGELSASELRGKIREYLDLSRKKVEIIDEQKANYKDTLEKKKQENFSKGAEAEGRMIKHLELKASEVDKDGNPIIKFLNKIQVKENASQGEIDAANNHNALVEAMGKKLQTIIAMKEPEQQAEVAIAAVSAHYFKSMYQVVAAELKKAREEVSKISTITEEGTPKRKPNNPMGRNGQNEIVDTESALSNFFQARR